MIRTPSPRPTLLALTLLAGVPLWCGAKAEPAHERRLDGFNIVATPDHPFGSDSARASLADAERMGARAVAIIPFLWQPAPASPNLTRGADMSDAELRIAIRDARDLGLAVLVKPQVWVPDSWAGAVAMASEEDWQLWFANYRSELNRVARIAAEEKAEGLVIGTELSATQQRPEWNDLIAAARARYSGRLLYMAHNVEEADDVLFWDRLDAIGVTLYPPLGADADGDGRRAKMRAIADHLDALATRFGKPLVVGEIGVRSAKNAAAKPWESAEQHINPPDPALQAAVIADWLATLDRPAIEGILIWDWSTDPSAGGIADTDFTVQGKPAEGVLRCAWTRACTQDQVSAWAP